MLAITSWKLKSNNIVLALPLLVGSRTFCFFLKLGLAHRLHGRQEMPCWKQLLKRDFSSASFKKLWNILTIGVISKSAEDLMECSIYHVSGNGVENRLLSFVCDKHNMSMFIMWSSEDLLQVYCSIYLLFLCLASVNIGINMKVVKA